MSRNTQPMSRAEVLALAQRQTTTNVEHLARAIGCGTNTIYDLIARDQWTDTRVLRIGRKILIPTADIVGLVGGPTASDAA